MYLYALCTQRRDDLLAREDYLQVLFAVCDQVTSSCCTNGYVSLAFSVAGARTSKQPTPHVAATASLHVWST